MLTIYARLVLFSSVMHVSGMHMCQHVCSRVCGCTCVCCTSLCVCLQCGYLRLTSCSVLRHTPHCMSTRSSGARHFGYFNELVYPKIPSLEWRAAHHTWAFIWVLEVLILAGQALYVCLCVCVCEALEMSVLSFCLPVGEPLFYCPGIVGAWAQWPDSPWGGTIVSYAESWEHYAGVS